MRCMANCIYPRRLNSKASMTKPPMIAHEPRIFQGVRIPNPSTNRTSDTSTRMIVNSPPTEVMTGPQSPNSTYITTVVHLCRLSVVRLAHHKAGVKNKTSHCNCEDG